MPRFFVDSITGNTASLTGEDAAHAAKSLRMRVGEQLVLCDRNRMDHHGRITSIGPDEVVVEIERIMPNTAELPCAVSLYVAMPKGDKLEQIVQKAVELGAYDITPVLTSRCISRPDQKSMAKRTDRLCRIALEAAKQCGRGIVPVVHDMVDYQTALGRMKECSVSMLCYEKGGEKISKVVSPQHSGTIAVMTGSEGGFSPEEADQAVSMGLVHVTLGARILRAETAPLYVLSVLSHLLETGQPI